MRYPYRKPEDDERSRNFTMVWAPVVRAMVQSGATGREWAVLVALMRFQDRDRLGLLHMGTHQISDLTGLSGVNIASLVDVGVSNSLLKSKAYSSSLSGNGRRQSFFGQSPIPLSS